MSSILAALFPAPPPPLALDPAIRDWVVFPLFVIMIITGLLRMEVGSMTKSSKAIPFLFRKHRGVLSRSGHLLAGAGFVCEKAYETRREYYTNKDKGVLRTTKEEDKEEEEKEKKVKDANPMAGNPMMDMSSMVGNASGMIQNVVMSQAINYLFSGYVMLKVPFPLTKGFKGMFQRGVDLPTLDSSYVSSMSWYFLLMYGLRGVYRMLTGDPHPDTLGGMEVQEKLGNTPGTAPPFNKTAVFKDMAEKLEIHQYKPKLLDSEKRLLGAKYPKRVLNVKVGAGGGGGLQAAGGKRRNKGDDIFEDNTPSLAVEGADEGIRNRKKGA